jgi:two-component system response regulator AgrA
LVHQQRLERILSELKVEENIVIDGLVSTSRPKEILEQMHKMDSRHLYFLDIDIKGTEKKGLEVAQEIRERDPYGTIVFVTTHSEFGVLTYQYKVAALDFIAKDQPESTYKEAVREAVLFVQRNESTAISEDAITFTNGQKDFQVSLADILYIETTEQPHKLRLIGTKQRIEFYAKLNEVEAKDERLLKCHRSFVVNTTNISRIDKKEKMIYFENGESCFVSRRKLKEISEKIKDS